MKKTIRDFKAYLDFIEESSRKLSPTQKKQLDTVLSSLLTLLVALKRDSGLGKSFINFKGEALEL